MSERRTLRRARLWQAARSCLGARFRPQGRDPQVGLDCIGLLLWSARAAGVELPDAGGYRLSDDPARLLAGLLAAGLVPAAGGQAGCCRAEPGLVVLLRCGGRPRHLAIASPDGLIHADAGLRRVVEHGWSGDWPARIAGCFDLPDQPQEA